MGKELVADEWSLGMRIQTNLRKIKSPRQAPVAGDVFALQLPTGKYLFGRVVLDNPPRECAPMPESYLVYIYAVQSDTMRVEHGRLRKEELLLAPIWTNKLGWTKGYFKVVGNQALDSSITLRHHCFRRYDGVYLDEVGAKLSGGFEPCGQWGLVSYRWIDDHVSDALNIPRAPVGERD